MRERPFEQVDHVLLTLADTPHGNSELRRRLCSLSESWKTAPDPPKVFDEGAAEQHARRYYRQDHFSSLVYAERAYFKVLADWWQRGQKIAHLSRRLGKSRERANCLARINRDLHRQLATLPEPPS